MLLLPNNFSFSFHSSHSSSAVSNHIFLKFIVDCSPDSNIGIHSVPSIKNNNRLYILQHNRLSSSFKSSVFALNVSSNRSVPIYKELLLSHGMKNICFIDGIFLPYRNFIQNTNARWHSTARFLIDSSTISAPCIIHTSSTCFWKSMRQLSIVLSKEDLYRFPRE